MITSPFLHLLAASADFQPADLPSLLLDLDPAAITGVADGGDVTSFPDAGPFGYHAATLVGTAPTFDVADDDFNGKACVVFGGAGKLKTADFASPVGPLTVVVVYAQEVGAGFDILFDGKTADQVETYPSGSDTIQSLYAGAELHYRQATFPTHPVARTFVFNGASSRLYQDGVIQASGNAGSNQMAALTVGGYGGGGNYATARIARFLVFSAVLSDSDRGLLESYLLSRYGLPSVYSRKNIYGGLLGGQGFAGFPAICEPTPGHLLCLFTDGTTLESSLDIRIDKAVSADGGKTWAVTEGVYTSAGDMLSPSCAIARLASGRLLYPMVLTVGTTPPGPIENRVLYSDGAGAAWAVLSTFAVVGSYTTIYSYGRVVEKSAGGDLYMPAYGHTALTSRTSALLLRSTDGGLTWALRGVIIPEDGTDGYSETAVAHLGGANWAAVTREDPAAGANQLWVTTSSDDGATWAAPTEIFAGTGGVAPCLLVLQSGGLLLTAGSRATGKGAFGALSADGGATWGTARWIYRSSVATPVGYGAIVQRAAGPVAAAWTGDVPSAGTVVLAQQFDESFFA